MTGHIRRRGERSWEIKFDLGTDPLTGKRVTRFHSFKGTKSEAKDELVRLKAAANKGEYVDPSKLSLGEFLDRWEAWAAGQVSLKTMERYSELLKLYVRPRLGASRLQRLRTVNFAELYGDLQKSKEAGGSGLAPRTVGHVHRLLKRIMGHALKWSLMTSNPVASADPPPVQRAEIEILGPLQIKAIVQALKTHPLYSIAVVRAGHRDAPWRACGAAMEGFDLDGGRIRVEQSLEQTKPPRAVSSSPAPGARAKPVLRFKAPKTKAGRRSITIPPSIVTELRTHWRRQQEERLALGIGKASDDVSSSRGMTGRPIRRTRSPPLGPHGAGIETTRCHLSRLETYTRQPAHRIRPRCGDGESADRSQQPDDHPQRLCPPVRGHGRARRQRGRSCYGRHPRVMRTLCAQVRWQSGGNVPKGGCLRPRWNNARTTKSLLNVNPLAE